MVSQQDQSKYTWQTPSHIIEAVRCKVQETKSSSVMVKHIRKHCPYIFKSKQGVVYQSWWFVSQDSGASHCRKFLADATARMD